MQAGRLDRFITIEKLEEREDTDGAAGEEIWTEIACNVPAQILSPKGTERFSSDQFSAQNILIFRIRWRDDLTVKHRIIYNDNTYDITFIKELGRKKGIEITGDSEVIKALE